MSREFPLPKSFPNKKELTFLQLLLCEEKDFLSLWAEWKKNNKFEDIDHATLKLIPLLYLRLINFKVSDELTGRIKGIYKFTWAKNQRLFEVMAKTSDLLAENRIPIILLKGLPMLVNVYQNTGARFLSDADILIPAQDIQRAINLMLRSGWHLNERQFPNLNHLSAEALGRVVKEVTLRNEQGLEIDLHWRLFEDLRNAENKIVMSFEELWADQSLLLYNGKKHATPSNEDLLMHVIVHGAIADDVKTLRFVTDAVTIIRTKNIDWDTFLLKAQKYNFKVEVYFALKYLTDKKFIELPEKVLKAILELKLDSKKIKSYYKKSNSLHKPFGALPRYWRTYWQFESRGAFPINAYYFLDYLSGVFGLSRKRDLIPFILKKYKQKLKVHLSQ